MYTLNTLQKKLRARFGAYKTGLSPPVTLSFQGDISVVVLFVLCLGVNFFFS